MNGGEPPIYGHQLRTVTRHEGRALTVVRIRQVRARRAGRLRRHWAKVLVSLGRRVGEKWAFADKNSNGAVFDPRTSEGVAGAGRSQD